MSTPTSAPATCDGQHFEEFNDYSMGVAEEDMDACFIEYEAELKAGNLDWYCEECNSMPIAAP